MRWSFHAPASVVTFSFTVYVQSRTPAEEGPLHWSAERGAYTGNALYSVSAHSDHDVFAVGDHGAALHWDGNVWRPLPFGGCGSCIFQSVFARTPADVYVARNDNGPSGRIGRFNGLEMTWSAAVPYVLNGVWASGPGDAWAAGSFGALVHLSGGTVQTMFADSVTRGWTGVWGSGPGDVWAAGSRGHVAHWTGTAWKSQRLSYDPTASFAAVWGTGPADVWVGGSTIAGAKA